MSYEKWLKTGVGRDFIKTIPHWASDSYPPRRTAVQVCFSIQIEIWNLFQILYHGILAQILFKVLGFFNCMDFTVYILFSILHQKHYTGFTSDLPDRLISHNELGYGWTSKYRPWKINSYKGFWNQSSCNELWEMVKNRSRERFY